MTETKTKICEVFVDISSVLFVNRSQLTAKNVHAAQPATVHTAYFVIAHYLVWSHSFWCDTWV